MLIESLNRFANEETCPVEESCQPGFVSGAYWGWGQARNRVRQLLDNSPRHGIPPSAVCFYQDGNKWCCVFADFIDLQQSPAGFGDTFEDALTGLQDTKLQVNCPAAKGPSGMAAQKAVTRPGE